jgi:hypothetical protein
VVLKEGKIIIVVMVAGERDGGSNKGRAQGGLLGLGRSNVLLGLIEISLGSGNGIGGGISIRVWD